MKNTFLFEDGDQTYLNIGGKRQKVRFNDTKELTPNQVLRLDDKAYIVTYIKCKGNIVDIDVTER